MSSKGVPLRRLSSDFVGTGERTHASSTPAASHKDEEATLADAVHSKHSDRADGKRLLKEVEVYEKLGFSFPTWKKWTILSVIFIVQVSM